METGYGSTPVRTRRRRTVICIRVLPCTRVFILEMFAQVFLFFRGALVYVHFAPRGTIETENLLYRFAKYLTAPPGAGWFCLFIFYSYAARAECASRAKQLKVDGFFLFSANNRKALGIAIRNRFGTILCCVQHIYVYELSSVPGDLAGRWFRSCYSNGRVHRVYIVI